jgi:hypothetical protein
MDILEVIAENIEAKNADSIKKLLKHYLENVKNKVLFSSFMINYFSNHYINKNLWLLRSFAKEILSIETNKMNINSYQNICLLLINNEFKNISLFVKGVKYDYDDQIEKMKQGFLKEYEDLSEFKTVMTDECYTLYNILYRNILHCNGLSDCFVIIKYLLMRKNREVFVDTNTKNNIIDITFMILMKFINLNSNYVGKTFRLGEDICEYVTLCKDIFYYNCKQKDKLDRINLLFYMIYILIQRKVKYQEIKYEKIESEIKSHPKNVDYLFVLIKYDPYIINMVRNDKELSKLSSKIKKTINITGDDLLEREKCTLDIIKI